MELNITHLQHYLAYGLRVQHHTLECGKVIAEIESLSKECVSFRDSSDYFFNSDHEDNPIIKPLLLPISALYGEIDGEIGIVELFKMYETRVFDKDKKYSVVFDAPIIDYKWEAYPSIKKEEGILRFIRKTSNMGDLVHSFRYDPELRRFSMYDDTNRRPLGVAYQIDLFEYLFSHHYDVFDLHSKGLCIYKNEI